MDELRVIKVTYAELPKDEELVKVETGNHVMTFTKENYEEIQSLIVQTGVNYIKNYKR